jgi:spore coat polysaccharide biosynthesis protein SpsF
LKTGFLITARLKSTRLPEKLLREIEGKPVFTHMLDRLKMAKRVDEIIVCTSTHAQDDRLTELAQLEGVSCFRGDADDVVRRLSEAATAFDLDYILSITGDCPFSDPEYADQIISVFEETGADLIRALDLPHGAYSYGVKPAAFRQVIDIKDDNNTEVWTRYFTDLDLFKVHDLTIPARHKRPDLRMTLDYPEDLEFFKAVFSRLYRPGRVFTLDEILTLLEESPHIAAINQHCAAAYKKRWTRQSSISVKSRYEVKSAAVIGCGSIGRRHLRTLSRLGINDLVALRSGLGSATKLDISPQVSEVDNWDDLIARKPDIAIIANPTSLHLETSQRLLPHVKGLFIEKPLADALTGVQDLLRQIDSRKVTSFVGYNLQFHQGVRNLRKFIDNDAVGKPLVLQCQVGQWIGDWHPQEDYRKSYFARNDLGGGAARSLIHEVHMATELFGPVRRVAWVFPDTNLVNLGVDMIADLMLEHVEGPVSQIHLDMIQRPAHRTGVLSCERGWISYDLIAQTTAMQIAGDSEVVQHFEIDSNCMEQSYIDEMKAFLEFVRQGKVRHEHDAWHATQSLAVVDAALGSGQKCGLASMPDWILNF